MKSTFDRSTVIKQLESMAPCTEQEISDGKGCTRTIYRGTGEYAFVVLPYSGYAPKTTGEMADFICRSSQTA